MMQQEKPTLVYTLMWDEIRTLKEHYTRQIDENRKLSDALYELKKRIKILEAVK